MVKITIHYQKAADDTVVISRTNMVNLDRVELGRVVLDSAGMGVAEFPLDVPVFAGVGGEGLAAALFLSPGDEITIGPSEQGAKLAVSFEGDGATVDEFINEAQRVRDGLEHWKGSYVGQLGQDEFLKARDSLQRGYDQLLANLKSNEEVSDEVLDLMNRYTRTSVAFYQYTYALGKDSSEIPASVREVVKEMPIDTIALRTGMFYYALTASFFYQHQINNAVYDENKSISGDSLDAILPLLIERKIKSNHYPKEIEDYLRVKSADFQIRMYGLTPNTLKLAAALEKEVASNEFKSVIREDIARWERIGPGKRAPEFTASTPEGKKLSLSDLQGKIVYVDIWATWCGPCVGEFPDSKKVMADFKGNDKVAFLFVSIDRDTLAWKNMVASDKTPKGIHVISGTDGPNSIWNLYYIWGVPRYLLIDGNGRMVATHADRPSSGKVSAELQKLLSTNQVAKRISNK